MLDTPCSEVVWRVLATHFHSPVSPPSLPPPVQSPCAITFQLDSTPSLEIRIIKIKALGTSRKILVANKETKVTLATPLCRPQYGNITKEYQALSLNDQTACHNWHTNPIFDVTNTPRINNSNNNNNKSRHVTLLLQKLAVYLVCSTMRTTFPSCCIRTSTHQAYTKELEVGGAPSPANPPPHTSAQHTWYTKRNHSKM